MVSTLHTDHLGSVSSTIGWDGAEDTETAYRPFGEIEEVVLDLTAFEETKGFIGERFDKKAALQYLNARYYDPKLYMLTCHCYRVLVKNYPNEKNFFAIKL